jgi:hypothetical protein
MTASGLGELTNNVFNVEFGHTTLEDENRYEIDYVTARKITASTHSDHA